MIGDKNGLFKPKNNKNNGDTEEENKSKLYLKQIQKKNCGTTKVKEMWVQWYIFFILRHKYFIFYHFLLKICPLTKAVNSEKCTVITFQFMSS